MQHLRAEQAQLAIADDTHLIGWADVNAFGDFARGGQRLNKDGSSITDGFGNTVEVTRGQCQKFSERAVTLDDTQCRPIRTMGYIAAQTSRTSAIVRIDLTDDARAPHLTLLDPPHELVAEHTAKTHVALGDF